MRYPTLILGSLAVLGTSSKTVFPDFTAPLVLGNSTSDDVHLKLRYLKDEVDLDCQFVSRSPSDFLVEDVFDDGKSIRLLPRGTYALENKRAICNAILVSGSNLEAKIVFWSTNDFPTHSISSELSRAFSDSPDSVVLIEQDLEQSSHQLSIVHQTREIVHDAPYGPVLPFGEECAELDVDAGLDWFDVPVGEEFIFEIQEGRDGCIQVNGHWFICLPDSGFPFDLLDVVTIEPINDLLQTEGFVFRTPDHELIVSRGDSIPLVQNLIAEEAEECNGYHDECGQWISPLSLGFQYEDRSIEAKASESVLLSEDVFFHLIRAESTSIVNFECDNRYQLSVGSDYIESVIYRSLKARES